MKLANLVLYDLHVNYFLSFYLFLDAFVNIINVF